MYGHCRSDVQCAFACLTLMAFYYSGAGPEEKAAWLCSCITATAELPLFDNLSRGTCADLFDHAWLATLDQAENCGRFSSEQQAACMSCVEKAGYARALIAFLTRLIVTTTHEAPSAMAVLGIAAAAVGSDAVTEFERHAPSFRAYYMPWPAE